MQKIFHNILIVSFLSLSLPVIAQQTDWKFYSRIDHINDLAVDQIYVWATSITGATRIDKSSGKVAWFDKTNAPFEEIYLRHVAIENDGDVWFNSDGNTYYSENILYRFDGSSWHTYDDLKGTYIAEMKADPTNGVWIAIDKPDSGLVWTDGSTWTWYNTTMVYDSVGWFECMHVASNGIWLGAGQDLVHFDGTNWTIRNYLNSGISNAFIKDIDMDSQGKLWLLNIHGLESIYGTVFQTYQDPLSYNPSGSQTLAIDQNDDIWIALDWWTWNYTRGLLRFDGSNWTKFDTSNTPMTDPDNNEICADPSGGIWFGCNNTGQIGYRYGNYYQFFPVSSSQLCGRYLNQIAVHPNGSAYLGTLAEYDSDTSLVCFDGYDWEKTGRYNNRSWAVEVCPQTGDLYVKQNTWQDDGLMYLHAGVWDTISGGPVSYKPLAYVATDFTPDILAFDHQGHIWMDYLSESYSTFDWINQNWTYYLYEGLCTYDGSSWTLFDSLNSPFHTALIRDISLNDSDCVWVATDYALHRYEDQHWTSYDTSNSSLPALAFKSIDIDSLGRVYFLNYSNGYYVFDGVTTTEFINPQMGMYSGGESIHLDKDGSVWVLALNRLIHHGSSGWEWFDQWNSPIPSHGITSFEIDQHGNKWIGCQFGLVIYREGGVVLPPAPPTPPINIVTFPNPFRDSFSIDFGRELEAVEIDIFDINGRLVNSFSFKYRKRLKLHMPGLRPGIFFYRVTTPEGFVGAGKVLKY